MSELPKGDSHPSLVDILQADAPLSELQTQYNIPVYDASANSILGGTLAEGSEDLEKAAQAAEGMCVECGDQQADLFCEMCQDDFCSVCFQSIHRKGRRKKHTTKNLLANTKRSDNSLERSPSNEPIEKRSKMDGTEDEKTEEMDIELSDAPPGYTKYYGTPAASSSEVQVKGERSDLLKQLLETYAPRALSASLGSSSTGDWFSERSKYIPLRLTLEERKKLRLVEAAMEVSEYTDKVDIISWSSKAGRIHAQLRDVCAILSGLMVASDYKTGQELVKDAEFQDNEAFFQDMFEIGRRHKVRNPEKMRSAYGKMVYMLQDSAMPEINQYLGFSLLKPVKTVFNYLADRDGLAVLQDELVVAACGVVKLEGRSRPEIEKELRFKDRALDVSYIYIFSPLFL